MKIIIDAMGGDHAPDQIVLGALEAARDYGVEITLVGRGAQILDAMKHNGWDTLPAGVDVANADDVVDMHDDPMQVFRNRKGSSLVQGLKMLADGAGDAFISAGNSAALLSSATLLVKRIRGVRRAAFAPMLPVSGGMILVDAGANVDCTPEFLLQFGCMGSFYAKLALGKAEPRVGLLNNGTEDTKGDALHKEAYRLLAQAGESGLIRFVGNVEARERADSFFKAAPSLDTLEQPAPAAPVIPETSPVVPDVSDAPAAPAAPVCAACGAPLEEGARFCTRCGTAVSAELTAPAAALCPTCGSVLDPDAHFCNICGTPTGR